MTQDERVLLGQILLDESVYHDSGIKPAQFSDAVSRRIATAISELISEGVKPDILNVSQKAGGLEAEIAGLTNVGSSANWKYYHKRVQEAYQGRELERLASEIKEHAKNPGSALSMIEDRLLSIYSEGNGSEVVRSWDVARKVLDRIEARYKMHGEIPGIPSGISKLDETILGFEDKKLYYVGARPSVGKSALLGNFAAAACGLGFKTGMITIESAGTELVTRILATETNIDSRRLMTGRLDEKDFGWLMDSASKIAEWPLWLYDDPDATIDDVRRRMRQMVLYHGVQIIFVDYVQLIARNGRSGEYRDRVAECSISLKAAARSLRIPVVSAAQLTRDSQGRVPTLADFADNSQIEKDADVAILIHREKGNYWLKVEKHRDGKTGDVPVTFLPATVRFVNRAMEEE